MPSRKARSNVNELEKQLLKQEVGDAKPRLCLRSSARVDAGLWLRRTPLWICVVDDDLVVLAVARRRFVAKIPLSECQTSHYQPASGEFVIEPTEELQFNRFSISPREAIELAEAMNLRTVVQEF